MPKYTWTIAIVLTALLGFGLLGYRYWQEHEQLLFSSATVQSNQTSLAGLQTELTSILEELSTATNKLTEMNTAATASQSRIGVLQQQTVALQRQTAALQQEKEQVTQKQRGLEEQMRSALQSKEITISELQGKLTVNILDRVLFDSGDAVLKEEGQKVLQQIAAVLSKHPNRQIHVIGHTDNVPIRATSRSRFASNWELSTARATAAVRFLQELAQVDPRRLGAVGYGEFQPVADNTTPEGRAKNRRIAVVILPEIYTPLEPVPAEPAAPVASPSPEKSEP